MRIAALIAVLLGLTLTAPAAQAQWKWKDANGQVHASDLPPPRGTPDKDILARPEPAVRRAAASAPLAAPAGPGGVAANKAAAPASGAAGRADPELEARRKRAEAEVQQKQKADEAKVAEQRAENCRRAREQPATLDSGVRIARVNARGEREVLDDSQRSSEAQRARQVMTQDCR